MALDAMIFDLDGTLVDSNAAHAEAWERVLSAAGHRIARDRIDLEIGKGGDHLVPSVLGEELERKTGDALRNAQGKAFEKIAMKSGLRVFPGAKELVADLRRGGMHVAMATSGRSAGLKIMARATGQEIASWFDVVATLDDAAESKPKPDVIVAAMRKMKMGPGQCAMVGDTPHDAEAALRAGAVCLGVTCGGMNGAAKLRAAGMRAVYSGPGAMRRRIGEVLQVASPGLLRLTRETIEGLMREALFAAAEAMKRGEAPIGAVLARGDGTILARAANALNATNDRTAHAEMVAFRHAARRIAPDARDLILVSTLEPCVMCLGAAMEASVDAVIFGLRAPADGGRDRVSPPVSPEAQVPRVIGGVLVHESRELFKAFLRRKRINPRQAAFARQLLRMTGGRGAG